MPLYEYQCQSCGERSEVLQRMSDPPLETCDTCGGPLTKLISAPAFQFKGTGWYVTDYGKGDGKGAKGGGDGSDGGSSDGGSKGDASEGGSKGGSSDGGGQSGSSDGGSKGSSSGSSTSSGSDT